MFAKYWLRILCASLLLFWIVLTAKFFHYALSAVVPYDFGETTGAEQKYFVAQFLVLALTALALWALTKVGEINARPLIRSLMVAVSLVLALSLIGFYTNSKLDRNRANDTGTSVSSRNPAIALIDSISNPGAFIGSFFGYECGSSIDETNCSNPLYLTGLAITESIIVGGVTTGIYKVHRAATLR